MKICFFNGVLMLYCLKCDRDVEFNSIALPNSVISSTSVKIIHICKNCGSNDLHSTKDDAQASVKIATAAEAKALLDKKKSDETFKSVTAFVLCILGVLLFIALKTYARYGSLEKFGEITIFIFCFFALIVAVKYIKDLIKEGSSSRSGKK